jgi:hypothetical protein
METPGTDLSSPSTSRVLEMPTLSSLTLLWITSGMDSTQDNSVCLASLLLSRVVTTTPSNTLELLLVKCVTSSMEIEEVSYLRFLTPTLELTRSTWREMSNR